jgi:predicted DNA-binding protein YlxM (UPF0122 family)
MLILRARANSQRSYEIHEFSTHMSMLEVEEVFKLSRQPVVNWIRENGNKVYSDYSEQAKKVIT